MPHKQSRRSLKAFALALITGLLFLLSLLPIVLIARRRNRKASNIDVVLASEFAPYAQWIVAQARHESANFTSPVYRANNNPFGLKFYSESVSMGVRGTKASDGGYYTQFLNDTVGWQALIAWLRRHKIPTKFTTIEQYAQALHDEGYYTDTVANYVKGLKFRLTQNG